MCYKIYKKKIIHKKKIPSLGQDNNKVLKSIGYSKTKIASFFFLEKDFLIKQSYLIFALHYYILL